MLVWSLIVGVVLFLIATCEFYTFKTGVPTVTSNPSVRHKMAALLRREAARVAALPGREGRPFSVLDLGSGTGKLALEIGLALPGAQVAGIEISITPYLLSRLRRRIWQSLWGVRNVSFRRADFWASDLSGLDAVVIYINSKILDRMAQKLRDDLPPGALVISNETHLPGWTPVESHTVGLLRVKVVLYRKETSGA